MPDSKDKLVSKDFLEPGDNKPVAWVAVALIVGIVMGHLVPVLLLWIVAVCAAVLMVVLMMCFKRSNGRQGGLKGGRCWGLLAVLALGAVWLILQSGYVSNNSVYKYITEKRQLVHVMGIICNPILTSAPAHGAFAGFSYKTKGSRFELSLKKIEVNNKLVPVAGKLLVHIKKADRFIRVGTFISARGWLSGIDPPTNPGGFNYKRYLNQQKGIAGRLILDNSKQIRVLSTQSLSWFAKAQISWQRFLVMVRQRAKHALYIGMKPGLARSMLSSVLLGQKDKFHHLVRKIFTKAGLPDFMAISGLHLGIFLSLVWILSRLFLLNPGKGGIFALIALGVFIMVVPLNPPVLRAAAMGFLLILGYISGRKIFTLERIALAAIVVLLINPVDLFTGGFQLSFGIVAGLIIFTPRVADWLCPRPIFESSFYSRRWHISRYIADYFAVSLVAFFIAVPIAMYHFHEVHLWTFMTHIISMPFFTFMLMMGYLKIFIGMIYLPFAYVLAFPLAVMAESVCRLIEFGASLPMDSLHVAPVGVLWVIGVLVSVAALFTGQFRQRRLPLLLLVIILFLWTLAINFPHDTAALFGKEQPAMTITMFDVGNGSCYLVRSGSKIIMFDCGSHSSLEVGEYAIVPALAHLAVHKIDALFISHADLDHFDGALDVADEIPIEKVITTNQVITRAQNSEHSAIAVLINGLRRRKIPIETIERGWQSKIGKMQLKALWPVKGFFDTEDNNESLVLSVKAGGRRMLFSGDIQDKAMEGMFKRDTNLDSDIAELPHHGSFVSNSLKWLKKVSPKIIFQSTGIARLHPDKWKSTFAAHPDMRRLISQRLGMTQVKVYSNGRMVINN